MASLEICSAKQLNSCYRADSFSETTILLASLVNTGQSVSTFAGAGASPRSLHQTTRVTTFAVSAQENPYASQSRSYQTFQNAENSCQSNRPPNGINFARSCLLILLCLMPSEQQISSNLRKHAAMAK